MSDPTSEAIRAEVAKLQTENTNLKSQLGHLRNLISDADAAIKSLEASCSTLHSDLAQGYAKILELKAFIKSNL